MSLGEAIPLAPHIWSHTSWLHVHMSPLAQYPLLSRSSTNPPWVLASDLNAFFTKDILAVHWPFSPGSTDKTRQNLSRGFPIGILLTGLHGYEQRPVDPRHSAEALAIRFQKFVRKNGFSCWAYSFISCVCPQRAFPLTKHLLLQAVQLMRSR